MRKRKRQIVKILIQCAAIIAAGVLAIILFMLAIWYRGKNSEPVTDEQVAAQMQQAEPLVIETPEAATEGSIRVYDYDGCCIYSYYGKIRINSDGNGKEYGLLFSLNALDEVQEKFEGYDKLSEVFNKDNPNLFKDTRWLLTLLINEALLAEDENAQLLEEKRVGRLIHAGNLQEVQNAIFKSFYRGTAGDNSDTENENDGEETTEEGNRAAVQEN